MPTPTLIQNPTPFDGAFASATTAAKAFAGPSTNGDTIYVFATCGSDVTAATPTCVDDKAGGSNSYSLVNKFYVINVDSTMLLFKADNAGPATNVTVNYGGASVLLRTLHLAEFSNVAAGAEDTKTAGVRRAAGTTTITDNSMTTTVNGDLIFTMASGDAAVASAGAGNTLLDTTSSGPGWEYQVQATAAAIANTIVIASAVQCGIMSAAFKAAAGGAAARVPAKVYNRAAIRRASTY